MGLSINKREMHESWNSKNGIGISRQNLSLSLHFPASFNLELHPPLIYINGDSQAPLPFLDVYCLPAPHWRRCLWPISRQHTLISRRWWWDPRSRDWTTRTIASSATPPRILFSLITPPFSPPQLPESPPSHWRRISLNGAAAWRGDWEHPRPSQMCIQVEDPAFDEKRVNRERDVILREMEEVLKTTKLFYYSFFAIFLVSILLNFVASDCCGWIDLKKFKFLWIRYECKSLVEVWWIYLLDFVFPY